MIKLGLSTAETTSTTGSGTLDLDGAIAGFDSFSEITGIASGDRVLYLIRDAATGRTEWELGWGTWTNASPDTLSRDTVIRSSDGAGIKLNLTAAQYQVIAPLTDQLILPGKRSLTSTTSLELTDVGKLIDCDASGGGFTVNLPSPSTAGDNWYCTVANLGATNNVTVASPLSGDVSLTLPPGACVMLKSEGTEYAVVGLPASIDYTTGRITLSKVASSDAVLTGGSITAMAIENSVIGASTPVAGSFTDLDADNLTTDHIILEDLSSGTAAPPTGAGEIAVFSRDVGGVTKLFQRAESNGAETELGAGLLEKVAEVTASNGGSIDLPTCFTDNYDFYEFVFENLYAHTNNVNLYCRFTENSGSTYVSTSGGYRWGWFNHNMSGGSGFSGSSGAGAATTYIDLMNSVSNNASNAVSGKAEIVKPGAASVFKNLLWNAASYSGTTYNRFQGMGTLLSSGNAATGLQFYMSSGNITGTVSVYGRKE